MTIMSTQQILEGLKHRCPLCRARPGQPCVSICDGKPMLRPIHLARTLTGAPQ